MIERDQAPCSAEYGLNAIESGSWSRSWFPTSGLFPYIISCTCLIRSALAYQALQPALNYSYLLGERGFPGGASGKEPTCQWKIRKRRWFDPWFRKIPWRRAWQPTLVFLPRESHGQRSLVGYSPWDCKELDTTEQLTMEDGLAESVWDWVWNLRNKGPMDKNSIHSLKVSIYLVSCLPTSSCLKKLWQISFFFYIHSRILGQAGSRMDALNSHQPRVFCQF